MENCLLLQDFTGRRRDDKKVLQKSYADGLECYSSQAKKDFYALFADRCGVKP